MAIQLKSTKDVAVNGIKVVVYGDAGVGKTTLMGTAPNPLIISAEAGLLSLRGKDVPYIEVSNMDELYEAYQFATSPEADRFETICLDSISEIAEIVLASEKAKTKDPRQAYQALIDKYLDILRAFRSIQGKNIVFSAKVEKAQLSDGSVKFSMMLPGSKAGQQTPYFFDEVFALRIFNDPETKETSRWLQTDGDNSYVAKDRSGALEMFEEPDLSKVFEKIRGTL